MMISSKIFSVTDVNQYIKFLINSDEQLKFITVKGEISNFKIASNNHAYFSLKDKNCLINCVMFRTYLEKIDFTPKNGDEVLAIANVDVYPTRGTYQMLVFQLSPVGKGQQLLELEQLKKKLQQEGLFDESRKREINLYPNAIGVITAENSAAIKDIIFNINRRYPLCTLYFFPCKVQGDGASKSILDAFNESQKYDLDTLIIGRGGGQSEDLSAFNDETLVRAVSKSKCPVISAVGHEIDFTLIDYVSDKRASTPTGAAELATVDIHEIELKLENYKDYLNKTLLNRYELIKNNIQSLYKNLTDAVNRKISDYRKDLLILQEKLKANDPKTILNKGYSITTDKNGKIIDSINDLKIDDEISTDIKDGKIISVIKKIERQ